MAVLIRWVKLPIFIQSPAYNLATSFPKTFHNSIRGYRLFTVWLERGGQFDRADLTRRKFRYDPSVPHGSETGRARHSVSAVRRVDSSFRRARSDAPYPTCCKNSAGGISKIRPRRSWSIHAHPFGCLGVRPKK